MTDFIFFVTSFIIIYILYLLMVVLKRRQYNKNKVTIELKYIINKYKLNMENIKYLRLSNIVALMTSFDISLALIIAFQLENIFVQFIVGFLILIPLLLISYHIIGKIYQKKGMNKNV